MIALIPFSVAMLVKGIASAFIMLASSSHFQCLSLITEQRAQGHHTFYIEIFLLFHPSSSISCEASLLSGLRMISGLGLRLHMALVEGQSVPGLRIAATVDRRAYMHTFSTPPGRPSPGIVGGSSSKLCINFGCPCVYPNVWINRCTRCMCVFAPRAAGMLTYTVLPMHARACIYTCKTLLLPLFPCLSILSRSLFRTL